MSKHESKIHSKHKSKLIKTYDTADELCDQISSRYPDLKSLIKLPSDIVTAMIDGLTEYGEKTDQYEIDMRTYGQVDHYSSKKDLCIGCAATFALAELSKYNFATRLTPGDSVHTDAIKEIDKYRQTYKVNKAYIPIFREECMPHDWYQLESVIDSLRCGHLTGMFLWYSQNIFDLKGHPEADGNHYYPSIRHVINKYDGHLPVLATVTWKDNLHRYEEFRDDLYQAEHDTPALRELQSN